ncbi:isochorismatase family protein [Candidatus Bipolaricaulota bacterium]|nr:isochorismatase family protein [Candidatus Bipolaricaulota bacterium]
MIKVNPADWLIVVDYQNDFLPPDGALAVPGGDELVDSINDLIGGFPNSLATQDWHPGDHYSFQNNGGKWPAHCVQGTLGADFHPDLKVEQLDFKLKKGFDPEDRSDYSGFSGETSSGRKMIDVLKTAGAERLFVAGLALDYCVRATALDGLERDFPVFLLEDCTESVKEEDGEKALKETRSRGGEVISSSDLEL